MTRSMVEVAALLLLLSAGCGASAHGGPTGIALESPAEFRGGAPAPDRAVATPVVEGKELLAGEQGGGTPAIPRKMVYTGRFVVDVQEVKEAQDTLLKFIVEAGGHLQQLQGNTMVLRLPSASFAEVEPRLRQLGRVDDQATDIRAEDITEEYYDVELRLQTKRKYLESLQTLLDQAGKLADKLEVQREIARVVEEIERLEGRLRLLSGQVALATVTVTFRLAHSGPKRTFRLPWEWLDTLGLEGLVN